MYFGKSKGRTVRAMTDSITKLSKSDATKDDSNLLRKYEGRCKLAGKLRSNVLPSLTFEECRAILVVIHSESAKVPSNIMLDIIEKRVNGLLRDRNYKGMVEAINPWMSADGYDPIAPSVATLADIGMSAKLKGFAKFLFARSVVPLIMQGEDGAPALRGLVSAALEALNAIDFIDLGDEEASALSQALTALRCIVGLLDMSFDGDTADCIDEVKKAANKKGSKSILASIGCALEAESFYEAKLNMICQIKCEVAQFGPQLKSIDSRLETLDLGSTSSSGVLEKCVADFQTVSEHFPSELLAEASKRLEDALGSHWTRLATTANDFSANNVDCVCVCGRVMLSRRRQGVPLVRVVRRRLVYGEGQARAEGREHQGRGLEERHHRLRRRGIRQGGG